MGLAAEVAVNESKEPMSWLTLRMRPAQNVIYPGQPFAIIMTAYVAFGSIASAYTESPWLFLLSNPGEQFPGGERCCDCP
jgi:hypothetical protein